MAPYDTCDRIRFEMPTAQEALDYVRKFVENDARAVEKDGVVYRPKVVGLCEFVNVSVPAELLADARYRRHWLKAPEPLKAGEKGDDASA